MYDYVTREQIETTNTLIEENTKQLELINENIVLYGNTITIILILAIILLPIIRKALGVK